MALTNQKAFKVPDGFLVLFQYPKSIRYLYIHVKIIDICYRDTDYDKIQNLTQGVWAFSPKFKGPCQNFGGCGFTGSLLVFIPAAI